MERSNNEMIKLKEEALTRFDEGVITKKLLDIILSVVDDPDSDLSWWEWRHG